jgi:hypothetical protein
MKPTILKRVGVSNFKAFHTDIALASHRKHGLNHWYFYFQKIKLKSLFYNQ